MVHAMPMQLTEIIDILEVLILGVGVFVPGAIDHPCLFSSRWGVNPCLNRILIREAYILEYPRKKTI